MIYETTICKNFREDVRHLIRFHFAKRDETLTAALERLSELDGKAKEYKE